MLGKFTQNSRPGCIPAGTSEKFLGFWLALDRDEVLESGGHGDFRIWYYFYNAAIECAMIICHSPCCESSWNSRLTPRWFRPGLRRPNAHFAKISVLWYSNWASLLNWMDRNLSLFKHCFLSARVLPWINACAVTNIRYLMFVTFAWHSTTDTQLYVWKLFGTAQEHCDSHIKLNCSLWTLGLIFPRFKL